MNDAVMKNADAAAQRINSTFHMFSPDRQVSNAESATRIRDIIRMLSSGVSMAVRAPIAHPEMSADICSTAVKKF